jgi:hypothetical protein
VKFETTSAFERDVGRLKLEHLEMFKDVVRERFAPGCDAWLAAQTSGGQYVWPASLRVSRLRGRPDVWEMTWNFASPDGRATFEFVHHDGEWFCRWRRVGDHSVYSAP